MTVQTETRVAGPFVGDGVIVSLPFDFVVFEAADLIVISRDDTTGDDTVLVLTTDYSVVINADQDTDPGGTITLVTALAAGNTAFVYSSVAALQEAIFTNTGGFYPSVLNTALDKLTILVQQIKEAQARSVLAPVGETAGLDLPPTPQRAGLYLAFDALGDIVPSVGTADGGFREDAAASGGSALIGFLAAGAGAVARTMQDKGREIVTPADYRLGSDPDDTLSIQRAMAASLDVKFSGDYTVSGTGPLFNIRAGQRLWGKATITHSTPNQITFNAVSVNEWAIDGITVVGSGNSSGTAAALYVAGCNKWRATNFIAKSIDGWGIKIDPGTHVAPYSDQGVLTGCSAHDCYYGIEGTAGTGAEYIVLLGWVTTGCSFGTVVAAGNWQFFGGSDTENTDGFTLLGGSNNAHGQAVARNFSHNTGENVKVNGATNGFTFVACHSYANDATHGYITLIDTKDINWLGGKIDAPIRASGTTTSCTFSKITFPGTLTAITGTAASAVRVDDCRTLNGAQSALNTPAPIYVEATRATSTQDVSAGATTLILNNEVSDIGAGYDNTTGVFTAPWACVVELDAMLEVTAASGLADSYVAVDYNNGTTIGYIPMVAISGTVMLGSGVVKVTLAAGDTLRLKSTITGTTPVLAVTTSRISITQIS